jgi:uncharacterized protein (DUF2345 family)
MLLTSDAASTSSAHLLSREAAGQIEQATQLATDLAGTARKHNAGLPADPEADKLPVISDLWRSSEVVQASRGGSGGRGSATAYSEPHLQLSAPACIAALTPASAVFSAGESSAICAGQDINLAAQGGWFNSATRGISLFTYGKASNANRPVLETGIRLHAASGKVSSQSQAGPTHITSDKVVTVASVSKSVAVAAHKHVLLTAQGAYIKLEGGNIEVHAPGKVEFKATMKELGGPASSKPVLPLMPQAGNLERPPATFSNRIDVSNLFSPSELAAGVAYRVTRKDGSVYGERSTATGVPNACSARRARSSRCSQVTATGP